MTRHCLSTLYATRNHCNFKPWVLAQKTEKKWVRPFSHVPHCSPDRRGGVTGKAHAQAGSGRWTLIRNELSAFRSILPRKVLQDVCFPRRKWKYYSSSALIVQNVLNLLIDIDTSSTKPTPYPPKIFKWIQNVYTMPHDGSTGEWKSAPRMVSELGLLQNRFRWGHLAKWEGPAGPPRHSFMNFEFRSHGDWNSSFIAILPWICY